MVFDEDITARGSQESDSAFSLSSGSVFANSLFVATLLNVPAAADNESRLYINKCFL